MKNLILVITTVFILGNATAQDISNDLLGKWKLQEIEIDGTSEALQDVFQTSEVYQVYKQNGKFSGIVGAQIIDGTWKLLNSKKNIFVKAEEIENNYNVLSFENNKMILELKIQEQTFILKYKKEKTQRKKKPKTVKTVAQSSNFDILDSNKDGILNPYEALDVLLTIEKQRGKPLRLKNISEELANYKKESVKELEEQFTEADKNGDGIVKFDEVTNEFLPFLKMMDTDNSQSVTKKEMEHFNFEKAIFLSDNEIKNEVNHIFQEFGTNGIINLAKIKASIRHQFSDFDLNSDKKITKKEARSFLKANSSAASFKVDGKVAYMNGTICSSTPATVLELLFNNPQVKTIEMQVVPGSIDDVSNLRASLYIHKFGLNTRVTSKSMIASGGTDFFLAGHKREIEKGAIIGVHSWGGGETPAVDVPKEAEVHKKYLDYYAIVNIPQSFYWFTLKAASANNIHNMTEEEIVKYKVRTN